MIMERSDNIVAGAALKSGAIPRGSEAFSLVSRADYGDLLKLSVNLLRESVGTRFQNTAGEVAKSWLGEMKKKQNSQLTVERFLRHIETVQPNYRLILSLGSMKRVFVGKLFGVGTTLRVLSDMNAENLYVVSSSPTTDNILEYCGIYADALIDGCDYFGFMVHGEGELEESELKRIAKDDWYAFS